MPLIPSDSDRLAIDGGLPIRSAPIPYGHQSIDEEDCRAVEEVLRSDWLTTGPKGQQFEEALAARVGARYAVSFSSGTAALHGAAWAAGLQPGDEAITSPMTFCATANCVLYQGARPVFADVSGDTLNIDPVEIAHRITARTRAILPVDYTGHPADLQPVLDLAERHGLVVIEDACHALGATYRGQPVGSLAHMTVFSFHPVKHITTGEGGMVTTDDPEFARRLRLFRTHGIERSQAKASEMGRWYYEMTDLGYNYRLPDIGAALGLTQLRRLEPNLGRRREIALAYSEAFSDLPGLTLPAVRGDVAPAWHLYCVKLKLEELTVGRRQVFEALSAEGLGVNVHYIPVHLHPYYRREFGYGVGDYPVAEAAYERLISLPLFHSMADRDVEDVIAAVSKVLRHYKA